MDGCWETVSKSKNACRRKKRQQQRWEVRQEVRQQEYGAAEEHLRQGQPQEGKAVFPGAAVASEPAAQARAVAGAGVAPLAPPAGQQAAGSASVGGGETANGGEEEEGSEEEYLVCSDDEDEEDEEGEEGEGEEGEEGTSEYDEEGSSTVCDGSSVAAGPQPPSEYSPNVTSNVFVVTSDFPMQNVLLQMGLRLVSKDGLQISR